MRKYGLIGYPLGHSFSKGYFTDKFLRENIVGASYDNFPISDIRMLHKIIEEEPDLLGLNVTIPYKSQIISYLDFIDNEARQIGAVNVLKIKRGEGRIQLHGYNSDIKGVEDSISPYLGRDKKNAIVLGTGGSSRSVCYVLQKSGWNITQVSRNRRPGIIDYSDLNTQMLLDASLIINTTPLGMFPDTETRPEINYSLLNEDHILFDLVYNPELTMFLRSGLKMGCSVISGLKMLHSQAERAWQIWNDDNL